MRSIMTDPLTNPEKGSLLTTFANGTYSGSDVVAAAILCCAGKPGHRPSGEYHRGCGGQVPLARACRVACIKRPRQLDTSGSTSNSIYVIFDPIPMIQAQTFLGTSHGDLAEPQSVAIP